MDRPRFASVALPAVELDARPAKRCDGRVAGTCTLGAGDLAAVKFRPAVFVEVFLFHVTGPLSLPLLILARGVRYARNQFWLSCAAPAVIQNTIQTAMFTLVATYFAAGAGTRAGVSAAEVASAVTMVLLHRAAVGMKYAYAPAGLIARIGTEECSAEVQRLEMLTWETLPSDVMLAELSSASVRVGARLSGFNFFVGDAREPVNAEGVALDVLDRATTDATVWGLRLRLPTLLAALCVAVTGPVTRVAAGGAWFGDGGGAASAMIVSLAMFLNFALFQVLLRFLLVGVTTYHRRHEIMRYMDALIDDSALHRKRRRTRRMRRIESRLGPNARDALPFVDLAVPANVVAWVVVRQTIQQVGEQYVRRVLAYASFALLVVATAALLLLSNLVHGRLDAASLAITAQQGLLVLGAILSMARYAAREAAELGVQRRTLLRTRLRFREQRALMCSKQWDASELEGADLLIESALSVQATEADLSGFTIAGLSSVAVTRSIVGGLSAAVLVGAHLLTDGAFGV